MESYGGCGTPVPPDQEQRRRSERVPLLRSCPYALSESLDQGSMAIHRGQAFCINISRGGMFLVMDQAPPLRQVFKVDAPQPDTQVYSPRTVEVRWTRQIPVDASEHMHLVGVQFMA